MLKTVFRRAKMGLCRNSTTTPSISSIRTGSSTAVILPLFRGRWQTAAGKTFPRFSVFSETCTRCLRTINRAASPRLSIRARRRSATKCTMNTKPHAQKRRTICTHRFRGSKTFSHLSAFRSCSATATKPTTSSRRLRQRRRQAGVHAASFRATKIWCSL